MENWCEYFPKRVVLKALKAAQQEAYKTDETFVYGLEAAIQIIRNAESVDLSRAFPKKPILRNNEQYQCEINECPTCGHIVEGEESGDEFRYCPPCGQAIDWDG